MQPSKLIIMIFTTIIIIGFINIQGINSSGAEFVTDTSQGGYEFEGELIFHQELPVGLVAGTAEHPQLVEIKSIRFESTFGNAWGVTARVGWLPAIDAKWKLKTELLDEQGRVLRHSRDEEIIFTCKAAQPERTTMQYADMDMGAMHDQGRRYATRFRVQLEHLDEQMSITKSDDTKTHKLEITVVEQENKKLVTDASIVVLSFYILDTYQRERQLYTTDNKGRCEIKIDTDKLYSPLNIEVHKQDFAAMSKTWSNSGSSSVGRSAIVNLPEQYIFEMVPASPIGGIVQDKDGNAIEGAEVRFETSLQESAENISIRRSVWTDKNGQWCVESIPKDVDYISIGLKHPTYGGDHGTTRRITGEALLNAWNFKHIEVLSKGIAFTGVVLDEKGKAVPNATVMISRRSSSPFFVITDSKGQFKLVTSGNRSDYRDDVPTIIVEAPGYAPEQRAVDIEPNPESLEFHLNPGRTIKCKVINNQGEPVVGSWTVFEPFADNRYYSVWLDDTDSSGEFEIPNVADHDIKLTVGKEGFLTIRDYVIGPSETQVTVEMMRALTIQGTVTDAVTGQPIPNFEIAVLYSQGNLNERPVVFTDGKYELSFNETSSRTWRLRISAVGYEQVESEEFNIEEGLKVINFKLPRSSDFDEKTAGEPRQEDRPSEVPKITGIVRDEKGIPVSGAIVSTRPSLGEETFTNAKGEFSIRARRMSGGTTRTGFSEEATYILVRQKERNLAKAMELDELKDNLGIKLSPGVIFSGKVVDVNDKGIPEAEISMTFWISDYGYGTREPTKIDSDGNFEIRAVPVGYRYSVEASADGYGNRYVQVNTNETENERMNLEPLVLEIANLSVSGIVVDQFDQPISNARIYGYGNGQPSMLETYTNTKGQFKLENVCEGQISIQANKNEPERLHGQMTAKGGDMNIKIVVSEINSEGRLVPRQPPPLVGKPTPNFDNIKIDFPSEQTKSKQILICFWDYQQRPSRNCMIQLSKKAEELKSQDVEIIAVHVSKIEQVKLNEWIKDNNIDFIVGMITGEEEQTRFNWGVKSLPWLILTDKNHVVTAEGFSINDMNEQILN